MADETTPAPKKPKKPPQRRSYMSELAQLQGEHGDLKGRVDASVRLLKKATAMDPAPAKAVLEAALEILEGE